MVYPLPTVTLHVNTFTAILAAYYYLAHVIFDSYQCFIVHVQQTHRLCTFRPPLIVLLPSLTLIIHRL